MANWNGYSTAEWEAFEEGGKLAETRGALAGPGPYRTAAERAAYREGFQTRREDILNKPVAAEFRKFFGAKEWPQVISRVFCQTLS
jgi:hypothetical protein